MSSILSVIDRIAEYTEEDVNNIDANSRLMIDLQLSEIDVLQLISDLEHEYDIGIDDGIIDELVTVQNLADAVDNAITESKRRVI